MDLPLYLAINVCMLRGVIYWYSSLGDNFQGMVNGGILFIYNWCIVYYVLCKCTIYVAVNVHMFEGTYDILV